MARSQGEELALRADLERLVYENLQTSYSVGGEVKRGQHGKHHAMAVGTFRVSCDLSNEYALGIFEPDKQYQCEMRFSNGGQTDDRKADVRGLAIKLHGVGGNKLLPGRGHAREHDFLLVDHSTYFSRSLAEYLKFNRFTLPVQAFSRHPFSVARAVKALAGLTKMVLFHFSHLRRALKFASRKPVSLLGITYHSTTPYALGERFAVKYKLTTKAKGGNSPVIFSDGLGERLWEDLESSETVMEFGIVVQNNPVTQPVEDPTVDWEVAGARYIKLADITLPKQAPTDEAATRATQAIFSPWMSGNAHKPLGEINRARLWVYSAMSSTRVVRD